MSTQKLAASASRQINAVVVSAGLMEKTVKVRIGTQKWNNHIKKHFNTRTHLLVHDPQSSLRLGDIISISPGWRVSKHVHHVVNSIIAPFGGPIEARPAVLTEQERIEENEARKRIKDERRKERKEAEKAARLAEKGAILVKGKEPEGVEVVEAL